MPRLLWLVLELLGGSSPWSAAAPTTGSSTDISPGSTGPASWESASMPDEWELQWLPDERSERRCGGRQPPSLLSPLPGEPGDGLLARSRSRSSSSTSLTQDSR